MHAIIIFPDLAEVRIEQVHVANEITLTLRTTSSTASCPSCGTGSTRVQSRYTRRLHDLPSSGRPVHLIVHVRRFFCAKSTCAQKIFTERLPEMCRPHAQRTIQLQKALCQLGLASGGQAGAEIGSEQGYKGSQRAMYRYLATLEPAVNSAAKRGSSSAVKQPALPPNPLLTLSVQQATWLFFRKADELKQEERERLQQLRQASPQIETAYQLVEQFLRMVRERTGEQLTAWLAEVQASQLQAFDSFVTGVQQDQDAVLAGLTLPWSH